MTAAAASPRVALPVVTVPGELRLHLNGDELHAWHAPNAHTDGDLIVHFRNSDLADSATDTPEWGGLSPAGQ